MAALSAAGASFYGNSLYYTASSSCEFQTYVKNKPKQEVCYCSTSSLTTLSRKGLHTKNGNELCAVVSIAARDDCGRLFGPYRKRIHSIFGIGVTVSVLVFVYGILASYQICLPVAPADMPPPDTRVVFADAQGKLLALLQLFGEVAHRRSADLTII